MNLADFFITVGIDLALPKLADTIDTGDTIDTVRNLGIKAQLLDIIVFSWGKINEINQAKSSKPTINNNHYMKRCVYLDT